MSVSNAFRRAVLGLTSDEVATTLLTISGAGFTTFRVCDNDSDIVSNGQTFTSYPFTLIFPGDGEGAPVATVRIANISRLIGEAIDAATDQVTFRIDAILASNPDQLEKTFIGLDLRTVSRTPIVVEGEIQSAQFVAEPYPYIRVTPGRFRGMFF